jgi:hypothetical protein
VYTPASSNEKIVSVGGVANVAIAVAAANTIVKAAPGRVCRLVITAAGTTALTIFDNASTNSGTVLFATPASTVVGTIYDIQMPAQNGIVVQNTASGPAATLSFA